MNALLPHVHGPAGGVPLPAVGEALKEALGAYAGAVVAPVEMDDHSLLALGELLGVPTAEGNGGHVLYDVAPRPAAERRDLSNTRAEFPLHTDSAMLAAPHRYICLGCVEAFADGGGESLVVTAETLRRHLDPEALEALAEPAFPFMLQSDDRDEVTIQHVPILAADGTVRYRREALIDDGTLSDAHRHALAAFQETLVDPAIAARHQLRPGEVLVVDNHRALHGRTPIADERPRLLRRMKILA